jgi:septal ring factor EnvC (AmiA/AmiB activator)
MYYAFTTKHILDSKRIIIKGVYNLVKCPKCGVDVSTPVKTWPIPVRKPLKKGEESKIAMGIFECPNCKARFRAALEVETKIEETASIKNMVERIKGIKGELMQTLKNLREKIKTLETERANLMIEIEKLKKVAESKVDALESEVTMLREEVKSLRDLLGYAEEAGK